MAQRSHCAYRLLLPIVAQSKTTPRRISVPAPAPVISTKPRARLLESPTTGAMIRALCQRAHRRRRTWACAVSRLYFWMPPDGVLLCRDTAPTACPPQVLTVVCAVHGANTHCCSYCSILGHTRCTTTPVRYSRRLRARRAAEDRRPGPTMTAVRQYGLRVLVAEDDAVSSLLLRRFLERC